jgi:wobble nucleotide-excising tRNase
LLNYHSEYHFVFQKLYDFKTKNNLTLDESFTLANAARRVLESFSAFKKPNESGMQGFLNMAKENGIDSNITEKLYYFLNKYSHLDRIETLENTIENIENEGTLIADEILNIIKTIDPVHFSSMEAICKKN